MSLVKKVSIGLVSLIIIGGISALYLYKGAALNGNSIAIVYVKANEKTDALSKRLETSYGLRFAFVFKYLAGKMHLDDNIKKGRYTVLPGTTLIELVRLFREGKTRSTDMVIRPMISLDKLASKCGEKLEPDSADFKNIFNDSLFLDSIGFNNATVYALLLPDTYNLLWHTDPIEFMLRMRVEYDKFWNKERLQKAEKCNLTPIQVSILASIVSKETNKTDEMPMVAGMYINRLRKDMALQADPTVKFALNDQGIQRVLNTHLSVESPYNTYQNKGLPPGPICIPSKQSIEAVLDFATHDFLFMCAKDDFSGYHVFAVDFRTHLINASRYRKALDERGIK